MQIICKDGAVFMGDTAQDIVKELRKSQLVSPENNKEYMKEVSERHNLFYGYHVSTVNEFVFLRDLKKSGEIELIIL